jgi:hypothetical protein
MHEYGEGRKENKFVWQKEKRRNGDESHVGMREKDDFLGSSSRIIWSTETKISRAKAARTDDFLRSTRQAPPPAFLPLGNNEKQGICILLLLPKVCNTILESITIPYL